MMEMTPTHWRILEAWAAASMMSAGAAAGLSFPRQRDILIRLIRETDE
jgi:hypothetical protein